MAVKRADFCSDQASCEMLGGGFDPLWWPRRMLWFAVHAVPWIHPSGLANAHSRVSRIWCAKKGGRTSSVVYVYSVQTYSLTEILFLPWLLRSGSDHFFLIHYRLSVTLSLYTCFENTLIQKIFQVRIFRKTLRKVLDSDNKKFGCGSIM